MMSNNGISVADALALRNSGYDNGNNNGFGGDGWWIIILILFMGLGGWGRNGLGNNGTDGGATLAYNACCTPATMQGMTDAFNFNQLDNGLRGIQNGICDGFYATNNAIRDVGFSVQNCCCQTQQAIANLGYNIGQGFCGVDKSILQSDFHNQAGFNAVANQLASCCCDLSRGQEALKYELATNTNALLVAQDKNTDRIINYLTQAETDRLRTELQSAQFQLSQLSQTRTLIDKISPTPVPAFTVPAPYMYNYGACGINTCGCGCA